MKKISSYWLSALIIFTSIVGVCLFLYFISGDKIEILKEYDQAGNLIGTNEYFVKEGEIVMHGKFVNYNNQGVKTSEGQFLNNDIFGNCIYYFDDGKLKSVHFRKNSKVTLESTFYNSTGLLTKYVAYDNDGKPFFIIQFDEKGATRYDGNFQIAVPPNHKHYLNVGDTLKYSYIVANIPGAIRNFTIENVGVHKANIGRAIRKVEPCQIDVKEVMVKKGKNTIRSMVRYEFRDNMIPIFTDTLSFDVEVY